jgi:DNA-binding CsgD family transcriptional regulator
MAVDFRSGDALVAFGDDMRVLEWNEAAERLTGIPAAEAVGRLCWEVLGATDPDGTLLCHAGCSGFRMAREGRPAPTREVLVRAGGGRKRVRMTTVAAGGAYLHVLANGLPVEAVEEEEPPPNGLTDRQLEVLGLIADGQPAKVIAARLGIAEVTVRNHIRAILLELGAHSQLEAVAEARRRRIL